MLDAGEHLEEGSLRHVLGHVGEENGTRRQATGAPWRSAVCLAQIDRVEGFARNNSQDQREEDEGDDGVGVVAVNVATVGVDIAHGKQVKLCLAGAASCVDREQDGPCDDAAQKTNGDKDLEEAHEEVTVNGLVVKDVLVLETLEIF
jgi:hypothetical protein